MHIQFPCALDGEGETEKQWVFLSSDKELLWVAFVGLSVEKIVENFLPELSLHPRMFSTQRTIVKNIFMTGKTNK